MQVSCNKKVYPFCDVYALSNNMNATYSKRVKLFTIGVYVISTTQFYDYGNNIVVVVEEEMKICLCLIISANIDL